MHHCKPECFVLTLRKALQLVPPGFPSGFIDIGCTRCLILSALFRISSTLVFWFSQDPFVPPNVLKRIHESKFESDWYFCNSDRDRWCIFRHFQTIVFFQLVPVFFLTVHCCSLQQWCSLQQLSDVVRCVVQRFPTVPRCFFCNGGLVAVVVVDSNA